MSSKKNLNEYLDILYRMIRKNLLYFAVSTAAVTILLIQLSMLAQGLKGEDVFYALLKEHWLYAGVRAFIAVTIIFALHALLRFTIQKLKIIK